MTPGNKRSQKTMSRKLNVVTLCKIKKTRFLLPGVPAFPSCVQMQTASPLPPRTSQVSCAAGDGGSTRDRRATTHSRGCRRSPSRSRDRTSDRRRRSSRSGGEGQTCAAGNSGTSLAGGPEASGKTGRRAAGEIGTRVRRAAEAHRSRRSRRRSSPRRRSIGTSRSGARETATVTPGPDRQAWAPSREWHQDGAGQRDLTTGWVWRCEGSG